MDSIANQTAKLRLMTGGQMSLPITLIATIGGGSSNAAPHSDTNYPALMNLGWAVSATARYVAMGSTTIVRHGGD